MFADKETKQKRREICKSCGLNNKGICSSCLCIIKAKTSFEDQVCPIGKW